MSKIELAANEAWQLHSDAEFVGRMAIAAMAILTSGKIAEAKEDLALCAEHADRVDRRYRAVLRMIDAAEAAT